MKTDTVKPAPLLVDSSTAASLIGISRSFFFENLSTGRIDIKSVRLGKRTLYSVEEITEWVRREVAKQGGSNV